MFHYTPHHYAPAPQPEFDPYTFSSSSPYTTYDTRRSHLERLALAQRQQERREAEELLLRRRQHELAMEKEVERRRIAAYEAALQQQVYAELEEERQRRARQQAYVRQQQQREALEAEHARRVVAARQQELARRHQEQLRRQQVAEQQQQVDHAGDDSIEAHLQPFLQLLFESPSTPTSTTEPQQSQPAPESTPTAPATTNAESATLPAPAPVEEPLVEANPNTVSAAEKLQHHYRTHLHRRQALSTLSSLGDSLSAQQAAFALPSTLVFQPSPPSSTVSTDDSTPTVTPTPKLAFQSSNASFLAYEDFLVNLLSKIDAVSSGGDRTVKQARKALVKTVDAELSRLDRAREQAWAEQQQRAEVAPTTATEEQEADDSVDTVDLAPLLDSALPLAEDISSPSSPAPTSDTTPATTPESHAHDSTPTPLTSITLASLPNSDSPSTLRAESAASSDETLSVSDVGMEAAIDEVVRQAHKLGEEVVMLEKVELGAESEASRPSEEEFVVV